MRDVGKIARDELARRIVAEILDVGLMYSTWRDVYPGAFGALLNLRPDLEESVKKVFDK